MADDPVIVTGGSLKLKAKGSIKGEGKDGEHNLFRYENRDGKDGKLSGITINNARYNWDGKSEIFIHYEVPD